MKFQRPRRFEIYNSNPEGIGDVLVLVLSDDIPNALRSVVIACSLEIPEKGMNIDLPTYVFLPKETTDLGFDTIACPASPFTIPKNALVEKIGMLSRKDQMRVDKALKLIMGYEIWPD